MRKIAFIATNESHAWGGSEVLWGAVAERYARRGVQVTVSVKDWGAPVKQIEHLRSAGCKIFSRPVPSLARRAFRKFPPWREYVRAHLRKLGTGADLTVISQGKNMDGLEWMEAARSCGFRYAVIVQTASEMWWPDDGMAERLAESFEGASAVYFVSKANVELNRLQLATPLRCARVIRNPFNVRYDARPAWPSNDSGALSLACVGRLDVAQKSQDLLLAVLSLPHWRERNVRLSLVGSGINERGLRRMVENAKLTSVQFGGFVDDIEQVWSSHHALILPSRYEGMPLALVEAMLCGRPGIVTDVAGHRELVRDGLNGFLAKAPTVEFLDEAMNRAWDNRHRLKEMGEQAGIDVRKFVSPDPVEDFVRELLELVGSPAPATESAPQRALEPSQIAPKDDHPWPLPASCFSAPCTVENKTVQATQNHCLAVKRAKEKLIGTQNTSPPKPID